MGDGQTSASGHAQSLLPKLWEHNSDSSVDSLVLTFAGTSPAEEHWRDVDSVPGRAISFLPQ